MKPITLSIADGITQNEHNTIYGKQCVISSVEDLQEATLFDHVAGLFRNNERSVPNFLQADCLIIDCDNDYTDDALLWLTVERVAQRLPDVEFYVVFSRNHMKQKGKYSPRPRFHIYLPLSEAVTQAIRIRELKEQLLTLFPEFDRAAKDAARFIFGVEDPQCEYHEGDLCIDEFLTISPIGTSEPYTDGPFQEEGPDTSTVDHDPENGEEIPEGSRNNTLFHIALNALINCHDEAKARELFDKACAKCNPPLSVKECTTIWNSALRYRKAFKAKFTAKKQYLNVDIIRECLEHYGISVRLNIITKGLEVSDMPAGQGIPDQYHAQPANERKAQNVRLLPLFLTPVLKAHNLMFGDAFLKEALASIAEMNPYNPIAEMLDATQWDGTDRITVLCEKLGLSDWDRYGESAGYYCEYLRKWLHQALALAFNDGSLRADIVLVLQGEQGIGKTNFFRALAVKPEWFLEGATINMQDKDTIIRATSTWITELGELDATLRKEQSDLKSFLTLSYDRYRRPYGLTDDKAIRRTAFCATVNTQEVHRDITGSRRFVYIPIESIDKSFIYATMTPEWCTQLWRQAYEQLYLTLGRDKFFIDSEDFKFLERNNAQFRAPIPAETELRDLIRWDKCADTTFHDYYDYTASAVKLKLDPLLRNFTVNQIGIALNLLCKEYGDPDRQLTAKKLIVKGARKFRLPRLISPDASVPAEITY